MNMEVQDKAREIADIIEGIPTLDGFAIMMTIIELMLDHNKELKPVMKMALINTLRDA